MEYLLCGDFLLGGAIDALNNIQLTHNIRSIITHFIEKMQETNKYTKKYCHLKQEIQQLSDVIRYQKAISNSHVIPRQYKPKPVFISQPNNGKLQQSFDVQYEKIFFEHLSRVIKENEIAMGIKQARLDSLIQTVEKTPTDNELCDSAARQGNQHLISEARQKIILLL